MSEHPVPAQDQAAYSSGRMFSTESGWFAEWEDDVKTGECVGPFATEADAAMAFLA